MMENEEEKNEQLENNEKQITDDLVIKNDEEKEEKEEVQADININNEMNKEENEEIQKDIKTNEINNEENLIEKNDNKLNEENNPIKENGNNTLIVSLKELQNNIKNEVSLKKLCNSNIYIFNKIKFNLFI